MNPHKVYEEYIAQKRTEIAHKATEMYDKGHTLRYITNTLHGSYKQVTGLSKVDVACIVAKAIVNFVNEENRRVIT